MTAPIETTGAWPRHSPKPFSAGAGQGQIEGRSLGRIAWTRFKRDKVAVTGGVVVILLMLLAILAQPIDRLRARPQRVPPEPDRPGAAVAPKGALGGISWDHPLGVDPQFGRDMLSPHHRGLLGLAAGRLPATLLSVVIGVVLGVVAGYYGGWVDTVISRLMDIFLAFPLLLFAIAISASLQDGAFGLTGCRCGSRVLIFVIGFFNWPYMGRIVRGQTLSPARAGVRRGRPQPRRRAARTSSSGSCCPTWSRRSSSTRRC